MFHTEHEAVWVPEPVHTIWSREKSLFAAGIQTPVRVACKPASVPTVLAQHLPKFHSLRRSMPLPTNTPLQIHSVVKVKDKTGKANLIQAWIVR